MTFNLPTTGYPKGVTPAFSFDLRDDVLPLSAVPLDAVAAVMNAMFPHQEATMQHADRVLSYPLSYPKHKPNPGVHYLLIYCTDGRDYVQHGWSNYYDGMWHALSRNPRQAETARTPIIVFDSTTTTHYYWFSLGFNPDDQPSAA